MGDSTLCVCCECSALSGRLNRLLKTATTFDDHQGQPASNLFKVRQTFRYCIQLPSAADSEDAPST